MACAAAWFGIEQPVSAAAVVYYSLPAVVVQATTEYMIQINS